jgi:hypothetical protein
MSFYNEAIKNSYLDSLDNEGTRHVISYVFEASMSTEKLLEKDLYNFDDQEIGLVLQNMSPATINTAKSNMFHIKSYIDWSIKMGYRDNNINPLLGKSGKWAAQFVDKTKKIHWSKEEFYRELIDNLDNDQDKAILVLLFNGIKGEKFIELRELSYNDINWDTGEVFIKSRNESIVLFDEKDLNVLEKAYTQKTYYSISDEDLYSEHELIDSEYILKNIVSKRISEPRQVSMAVLYSRLGTIKEYFELGYLTPNALVQSGQIYMAYKLWKERGKLGKEEFNLIGARFNLNKMKSDGYEYYNRSAMKIYINENNIKKLYDTIVEID